ncbi:hypothetical protein I8751_26870 [Nostocaceae cyanobacterium CENA357]|uniref:Uncharacterized protein n=1 Tax=Atlanticothrix silvestris CENA357 TaxID=1725252 RepID=A0A8J7HNX7_9CYAN|nr:hypothetical protein [Atlanticothrix silvestris]MBH8555900.1 hypothetical protein [Atlanticothrix silvestris CENA357]
MVLQRKANKLIKSIVVYNKNQQDGFTINQLLIGLIAIGILAGIAIIQVWPKGQNPEIIKNAATQNLITFSKQAELEAGECANQDSDNNAYVDCTAKDKKTQLLSLECAYDKRGKSCKIK